MGPTGWIPDRADIIYIQHSPQAGTEMPGIHPLLVTSTKLFNEKTGIVIGFPMTHSARHKTNPFAVVVEGPNSEIGYIISNKPKSFDWKMRDACPQPWGGGHVAILDKALAIFSAICGLPKD